MSNVTQLDPVANKVTVKLREMLALAEQGKLTYFAWVTDSGPGAIAEEGYSVADIVMGLEVLKLTLVTGGYADGEED